MGSLFLEIGQCGCQIGWQLNEELAKSSYCRRKSKKIHALLIDTEPKVIQSILNRAPHWLDPRNVKAFDHGRGNNWSYGYLHSVPTHKLHQDFLPRRQFSHEHQQQLTRYVEENVTVCEWTLQRVRKELETVDCALAINVVCSLAGGTGSGLGTKMTQLLRDTFTLDVFGHFILPNRVGQTPLQVYNCSLALASLQSTCKALFTFQNEEIVSALQLEQDTHYSLQEVNRVIAGSIARLIRLNDVNSYPRFYSQLVSQCIASSQTNYLSLFGPVSHSRLLNQLRGYTTEHFMDKDLYGSEREKLIHGYLLEQGKTQMEQVSRKKIKSLLNVMPEGTFQQEFIESDDKNKGITLIANHSRIRRYLAYLVRDGSAKLDAKAYLWHYEYADLESAFQSIQSVVDQYTYFAHY